MVNRPDLSVLAGNGKVSHLPASRRCNRRKVSDPPRYVPEIRTVSKGRPERAESFSWIVFDAGPAPALSLAPGVGVEADGLGSEVRDGPALGACPLGAALGELWLEADVAKCGPSR